jgi:hypothetical protein
METRSTKKQSRINEERIEKARRKGKASVKRERVWSDLEGKLSNGCRSREWTRNYGRFSAYL